MKQPSLLLIPLALIAFSISSASESVTGGCSAIGSEGYYYLVDPLPNIEPDTILGLAEHPSGSKELLGHAILPPLPGEPPANIRQIKFERVSLHNCELQFSVLLPDGTVMEFEGRFVLANPFLVEHPPNPIALEGLFTVTTVDQPPRTYERALFYDSGY